MKALKAGLLAAVLIVFEVVVAKAAFAGNKPNACCGCHTTKGKVMRCGCDLMTALGDDGCGWWMSQ